MSKLKVLFHLFPLAQCSDMLLVRSLDLTGPDYPAAAFLRRLRAFGFDDIVISIDMYLPAWATQNEIASAREAAEAFAKAERAPYFFTPHPQNLLEDGVLIDLQNHNAHLYRSLPGEDNDVYLRVSMQDLFVPKDVVDFLINQLSNPETMAAFCHPGTGIMAARKSYFGENAKRDEYATNKDKNVLAIDKFPPPAAFFVPAFVLNLDLLPLIRALSAEPENWSYQDLARLKKERPSLFRPLPRHIGVELTNEDNLPRLRHPQKISTRPLGRMSDETFDLILGSLPSVETVSIDFYDFGEPLLHPKAIEFVLRAAQQGHRVDLYTNGVLLDSKKAEDLLRSGVDSVFFRLDAASRETYGRVSGRAEDYDRAVQNFEYFLKLKKENGSGPVPWHPLIAVQITEMPETSDDVEAFFKRYDHRSRISQELRGMLGREPRELEVLKALYEKAEPIEYAMLRHDNLYRGKIKRSDDQDMSPLYRFPCRQLFSGPSVLWNGDIVPCREDVDAEHVLGTVREGISAVLKNEKMADFYEMHEKGAWSDSPFCGPCKEWYYSFR